MISEPIGPVEATPVCNRKLARRVRTFEDLLDQTLIDLRAAGEDVWVSVLKARGLGPPRHPVLPFEGYFETLIAAERGLGVAFGLFPMTTEWVHKGRLAVPLAHRTPVEGGVYFVFRANDPRHALLTEVSAWLRERYAALPPLPSGLRSSVASSSGSAASPGRRSTLRRRRR